MVKKIIAFSISFCLIFEQSGFAQVAPGMHVPGYMARLIPPEIFNPVQIRAISFDPSSEKLSLFLDRGDTKAELAAKDTATAAELYKYFQIGLQLPNNLFWVNLRPDSPQDIIDPYLEKTDVGRILLAADLQLKKDLALFTSPDRPEGKRYWDKLYAKAESLFGQTDMEIPTFTRPWIVPGEIIIRESKDGAYIYKAGLRVMLEQDYLNDSPFFSITDPKQKEMNAYSSELLRAEILPKLTREVNSAKRYAALRQVYYSLVLAQWFKQKAQGQANAYSRSIDTKDLSGLTAQSAWSKDTYYTAYKKTFSEGEYNKEEQIPSASGLVIRTYFSGGVQLDGGRLDFTIRADTGIHTFFAHMDAAGQVAGVNVKIISPPESDTRRKDKKNKKTEAWLTPSQSAQIKRQFMNGLMSFIVFGPPSARYDPRPDRTSPNSREPQPSGSEETEAQMYERLKRDQQEYFSELDTKDGGIVSVIRLIVEFLQTPDAIGSAATLAWTCTTTAAALLLRWAQNKHISLKQGLAILALGGVAGAGVALLLLTWQSGYISFDMLSSLNLPFALSVFGVSRIANEEEQRMIDSRYEYIKGYLENSLISKQSGDEVMELLELFSILYHHGITDSEMMSIVSDFVAMFEEDSGESDKVYAYIEIMKEHAGVEERSKYALYADFLGVLSKSEYGSVPFMPMLRDFGQTAWRYLVETTGKNPLSMSEKDGDNHEMAAERTVDEAIKTGKAVNIDVRVPSGQHTVTVFPQSRDGKVFTGYISAGRKFAFMIGGELRSMEDLAIPPDCIAIYSGVSNVRSAPDDTTLKEATVSTGEVRLAEGDIQTLIAGIAKLAEIQTDPRDLITALENIAPSTKPEEYVKLILETIDLFNVCARNLLIAEMYETNMINFGTRWRVTLLGKPLCEMGLVKIQDSDGIEKDEIREILVLNKEDIPQMLSNLKALLMQFKDNSGENMQPPAAGDRGAAVTQTKGGGHEDSTDKIYYAKDPDNIVKSMQDVLAAMNENVTAENEGKKKKPYTIKPGMNPIDGLHLQVIENSTIIVDLKCDDPVIQYRHKKVPFNVKGQRPSKVERAQEIIDQLQADIEDGEEVKIAVHNSNVRGRPERFMLLVIESANVKATFTHVEVGDLNMVNKDGGGRTGGIDFRALPLNAQPGMNPAMMQPAIDMKTFQALAQRSKIQDLDKEWFRIEKQMAGKTMPYDKMKEYIAVCCERKASAEQLNRVAQCLTSVLRFEEACAVPASKHMKELLLLVEAART